MFYPGGNNTNGRTIICLDDNQDILESIFNETDSPLESVSSWLSENDYCAESWQLKEYLIKYGSSEEEILEMEGGAPAEGGGFASLDSTPGMGNPSPPTSDGTNFGFYNGRVGSGDKFPSLTAGTPSARRRRKKKKMKKISDFDNFVKKFKKNQ